ncbi:MAG: 6-phosphogluconolactonase [Deltaproteobacteria bacterium]|nr:6-phosphogluconolactonase [Deltaproteobacteria bacterium]
MKPEIRYFPDLEALSLEAAGLISQTADKGVAEKGLFSLVLSGGSTPRLLYELLSQPPFVQEMPWPHIHFFWGDERCVPPDHPESNYGLASRSLLSRIPVPEKNIHRIPVEKGPGPWAAREYEKEILEFFNSRWSDTMGAPSFDLVLLGLGKDGHTASLFPGDPALKEEEHLTAYVPKPGPAPEFPRITLTLPLINQAEEVLFLVSGAEKKEVLRVILNEPPGGRDRYPAARVNPKRKVLWYVC